eukprot:CAMPEP_0181196528 /NCGR_PEP_ID=MMETSP1096-20121128/15517_1 /TAXON_ID=156174 ORGANISM="Chrysochromulina ericina, Strain CCMP281" /NCGR_SAMPLE_ID=MMETSP1096 /ASSEMBLY_ACC=CAM_ASM_000453 /LENGTH=160 /DNA_ID=CAMNT_0023286301 /DNA_START=36 /DNA_END=518 /DNA_ORIENTATION=+
MIPCQLSERFPRARLMQASRSLNIDRAARFLPTPSASGFHEAVYRLKAARIVRETATTESGFVVGLRGSKQRCPILPTASASPFAAAVCARKSLRVLQRSADTQSAQAKKIVSVIAAPSHPWPAEKIVIDPSAIETRSATPNIWWRLHPCFQGAPPRATV